MGISMYEMNETQLRELIAKMRSRDPNSLEARMEKTELQDAEQLLREMVSKQKSRRPEEPTFNEAD